MGFRFLLGFLMQILILNEFLILTRFDVTALKESRICHLKIYLFGIRIILG